MEHFSSRRMSGKEAEEALFGTVDVERARLERDKIELSRVREYVSYKSAMEIARRSQGENDPTDPERPFANDLHASLVENSGLVEESDYEKLRFFTAVRSPLDKWHHKDGFFELDIKGRTITLSLDVTIDPEKEKHDADVIMQVPSRIVEMMAQGRAGNRKNPHNLARYDKALSFYTDQVTRALREKVYKEGVDI